LAKRSKRGPPPKEALLQAILPHVVFDGWSPLSYRAAVTESGVDPAIARAVCPRGALDLAVAFHHQGDDAMAERLSETDLGAMRFRDRVAAAVRYRLEAVPEKELVRRGTTLFALPQHGAEGARLIWGTADRIWTELGDQADDINWYTKRAILAGVYGATVLYWLGDESAGNQRTWDFLDRRIEGVMRFEKMKAQAGKLPFLGRVLSGPAGLGRWVKPPRRRADLPGQASETGKDTR
jgi:ubiquinone biosynthesis protein COQ9